MKIGCQSYLLHSPRALYLVRSRNLPAEQEEILPFVSSERPREHSYNVYPKEE